MDQWTHKVYQCGRSRFCWSSCFLMKWLLVAQAQVAGKSAQLVEWVIANWGKQFVSSFYYWFLWSRRCRNSSQLHDHIVCIISLVSQKEVHVQFLTKCTTQKKSNTADMWHPCLIICLFTNTTLKVQFVQTLFFFQVMAHWYFLIVNSTQM